MTESTDPLTGIVSYLRGDVGLDALVDNRVYREELPRDRVVDMPEKCIVVTSSGRIPIGLDSSYVRHGVVRIDLRCYGETFTEGRAVYWEANRALRELAPQDIVGVRLYNTLLVGGPLALREADVDWPMIWASYGVTASEVAVEVPEEAS